MFWNLYILHQFYHFVLLLFVCILFSVAKNMLETNWIWLNLVFCKYTFFINSKCFHSQQDTIKNLNSYTSIYIYIYILIYTCILHFLKIWSWYMISMYDSIYQYVLIYDVYILLCHHMPSGLAGCCLFPPSPSVKAGHTHRLWFANAI